MKRKKLQYSELRSLDSAIEQLQALVDGLRAGVLQLERGEQQLLLRPGAVLDFALAAERQGVQERFELTLEWRRQELTIGSGPLRDDARDGGAPTRRSMQVPAGRGLALQAEAERLFDEDDAEAPLSSDDDYTLAPDEVDVPLAEGPLASASAMSSVPMAASRDEVDDEAVTVRHSSSPGGQPGAVRDAFSDAEWFERLYAEARAPAGDGRPRLDEQRFADSLAAARLEPQLQQELCSLARQADAEGRERLFQELRISELIARTLSGAA